MLGPVIAQTQKYVNIILEPSAVTADSIQKAFHGADEYLISLDYSQTTGAEEINFLYLDSEPTDIEIKYSGKPRLNRDIISAKKYVTIHLEGDDFELKNADYLFQCGEYLVGDIDLSKIKKVTSMRKAFDGDTNVTNVTIDKGAVVNAAYTFRNTSIEKLDMNEFRANLPAESYEGIISGVTSLKEITIDNRSSLIWNDVKANLSNDIKVFSANKCNYVDTLNCTNWSACEIFEVGSEHLESLTLFSNKSALKSFVLKAPQLNIGSSLSISAGELERFELETAGLETLTLVSEKLKSVDLSKCRTLTSFDFTTPLLEELDVSNTAITELNLLKFTNLKAPGSYKDILGWYAKNCTELRNVLIRMDQVRADVSDSPLQLDRCTALQNVTVYTDSAGETGGLEYHYGTEYHYGRMFLNDKEIQPGGGGSANIVEITQAEYDKLTPSERKDIVYMITDGVPGSSGDDEVLSTMGGTMKGPITYKQDDGKFSSFYIDGYGTPKLVIDETKEGDVTSGTLKTLWSTKYLKNESLEVTLDAFLSGLTIGNESPFQFGSVNILQTVGVITSGWYTYLYLPHRSGIASDGYKYGTLLMFSMTGTLGKMHIYSKVNGNWSGPYTVR